MDFRRASGTIWHATSALRTFRPLVSRKPTPPIRVLAPQQRLRPSYICQSCRYLSTGPIRQQKQQQNSDAQESQTEAVDELPSSPTLSTTATESNNDLGGEERGLFGEALGLEHTGGVATNRMQRFHSPSTQTAQQTSSSVLPKQQSTPPSQSPGNSYTDALNALSEAMRPATSKGTSSIYNELLFPSSTSPSKSPTLPFRPPPRHEITHLRLSSRTGRTMEVFPNDPADLASKLRRLATTVIRNRIPQDFIKQRFHERPGLKRKRLRSQRWRAKFKWGFGSMVGKVAEMRRMGW